MTSLCNHCNLLSPHTPAYTRAPRHPVFASATTPHPTPRARRTPSFPLYSAGKPEPPPTAPTHLPTSTPCITTSDRPRLRTPFANIPTSRKAEKLAYQETNTPRSRKPGKLENQEAKKSETWKVGKPAHATTTRSSTHPKTTALTATGNHRSSAHPGTAAVTEAQVPPQSPQPETTEATAATNPKKSQRRAIPIYTP